jgi:hypothetical protein
MAKMELLLEAERRGILPPDKAELLSEARRRGLVGGGKAEQPAPTGSVYQQFPSELSGPTGNAALAGASDDQMADIVQKSLGDKFVSRERTKDGYHVFTTRGADGKEQRAYLNQPGLDREDVARGVRGALPYFLAGGLAGVAVRGGGLLANALAQAAAGGATSVAGDVAQIPMGSEQEIEWQKALSVAAMSGAAPLIGRAVGNGVGYLKDKFAPVGKELNGMSRGAIDAVEEAMRADGNMTPQSYAGAKQQLGPEAMLGDMGATLQGDAAVLARTPVAKDIAANNIAARTAFAPDRIKGDVNVNIGQERNLPEYLRQQQKFYKDQARPFYEQFEQAPILATKELNAIMSRVPRSAFNEAERLAKADGIKQKFKITQTDDVLSAMTGVKKNNAQRVIQGVEYDYVKRAVDDLAKKAAPGSNEQRIFSNLARELRNEVDSILSPSNPSLSPWAQARSIAGEGIEGRDAVELGAGMFSKKKDPNLVAAELSDMSAFGKDMAREGGRNDLRQIMGRASSNFGPKGDTAARRALNNEFAQQNLEQIAGPQGAQNIANRIRTENQFADLHELALRNSVTDTMQASRKRLGLNAEPGDFASEAGKKGPFGLTTEYGLKVLDALIGSKMKAAQTRKAVDMAKILTTSGPKGDAIVRELFKHMEARNAGKISGQKYERIVNKLLEGTKVPAYQSQR